jgi:hypothetical protein
MALRRLTSLGAARAGLASTALCAAAFLPTSIRLGQEPAEGVLPRLTPETYDQAKACGRAGADCASTPYLMCPSESAQYSIRIATPFSRVASAVLENLKLGKPGRGMDRSNANRWGMGLYVLPAEGSARAAGIEHVEIRRDGLVIQPKTATVGPIAVKMTDGSSKQLARGYFSFAPENFAPSTDVTLVLKGTAGETTCVIDRARLQKLR